MTAEIVNICSIPWDLQSSVKYETQYGTGEFGMCYIMSICKFCTILSSFSYHQGPLLLKWFNFNPRINNYIHYEMWDEITVEV